MSDPRWQAEFWRYERWFPVPVLVETPAQRMERACAAVCAGWVPEPRRVHLGDLILTGSR